MNATFLKATRIVDGTVVADVYDILYNGTPVLYEYLRAMGATDSGQSALRSREILVEYPQNIRIE